MSSPDLWLAGFALRCGALLLVEIACFLFVVPTLFNLHSDLADAGAALVAVAALLSGALWGAALAREFRLVTSNPSHSDKDHE